MQRGNGRTDDFFSFGGFGGPGNLMSSFLGGRDPFDDPFFTQPFGSFMGRSLMGPSMFGPSMFTSTSNAGFLEQQAPPNKSKGPIIEELPSDGEEEEGDTQSKEKIENPRKHSRSSNGPYIEEPDEETEEKKSKHMEYRSDFGRANTMQPQAHTYSFHSSTVTYGGPSGAYYTSSKTRKSGGDGVTVEESKEADATTGKATHNISRRIRDKGHSVTRKLNENGRVHTLQTLHNLNEDELGSFEEKWKGNARRHIPGLNLGLDVLDNDLIVLKISFSWSHFEGMEPGKIAAFATGGAVATAGRETNCLPEEAGCSPRRSSRRGKGGAGHGPTRLILPTG